MRLFWTLAMQRLLDLLSNSDFAIPDQVATLRTPPPLDDLQAQHTRLIDHLIQLRARVEAEDFTVAALPLVALFMQSRVRSAFGLAPWLQSEEEMAAKFATLREQVATLQRTITWLGSTVREPDAQRCVTPVAADPDDKTLTLRRLQEARVALLAKLWSLLEFRDEDTHALDDALDLCVARRAAAADADAKWQVQYNGKTVEVSAPPDVEPDVLSWLVSLRLHALVTLRVAGPPPSSVIVATDKGKDLLSDLIYFREKSPLISARARNQVPLNTLQDVKAYLEHVRQLVSDLLKSGGQTLQWLEKQAADVNALLGLKAELQSTAKYLRLTYNDEDLDRHISAGSEILHFLQFAPHLHGADGCTALYRLEPSEALVRALEAIRDPTITLREADVHRTNLRKELRLPLPRARIFTQLKEAKPVVEFLRSLCNNPGFDAEKARAARHEFEEQCRVRQEAMSSHRFIVDDIRCIQRTWDLLAPLLGEQGVPTMAGVLHNFNALSEACRTDEDWDVKLRQLRVAADHLPQIKRLFNRAASFDINMLVPLVEHYMKVAVYRSRVSAAATRLTLDVPEEEKKSDGADLANLFIGNRASAERSVDLITDVENLLSSSQVFLTDHLRPDEVDLVGRFRRVNVLAHRAHDLRCKARRCSYPIGAIPLGLCVRMCPDRLCVCVYVCLYVCL